MLPFIHPMAGRTLALIATASPASASGSRAGAGTVTTGLVTVSVLNGVAPVTYSWSGLAAADNPTSASTTFSMSVGNGQGPTTQNAVCTVTDGSGQSLTVTVPATFSSSFVNPPAPPTISVDPSPTTVSRTGAGSVSLNFTCTVTNMGGAHVVNGFSWLAVDNATGTFGSGGGSSASFSVNLAAGQTKTGFVQFTVSTDTGLFNATGSYTAHAT